MKLADVQITSLGEQGYFVVDAFLTGEEVAHLHQAAVAVAREGGMAPAGVRRGGAHRLDQQVRSDRITWLDPAPGSPFLVVHERLLALRDELNAQAWLGLRSTEVQLAWYHGEGAHYDPHLDSFPGADNRRLSAVLYLNPAWQRAHGGLLRLHLNPSIDVEPIGGRLVVFLSEKIEHEVLPVHVDRYAIAAWFSK
jgi:SM-20-related protein